MFGLVGLTPLLTRIIAAVAIILALIGGGWYLNHTGYKEGHRVATEKGQLDLSLYKDTQRKLLDEMAAANRLKEADLQTKLLQSMAEKENEIQAINDHHQRLIDGLRQRAPRRNPVPTTPGKTPASPTPECPRAGSTGAELSREDGEFLVGEASAADSLRKALKMCREAYSRIVEGAYKKP